jgi:hypothetical protein
VALNGISNERLFGEARFKNIYIIPAAEDSGPAIGAAYHGLWSITGNNSLTELKHDSCGRLYSDTEILTACKKYSYVMLFESEDLIGEIVDLLCDSKVIGWFQRGSEFGPRALGQRSILCDARHLNIKERLDLNIKLRERFRHYAPIVLADQVSDWFYMEGTELDSPFMLRVCKFRETGPYMAVDFTGTWKNQLDSTLELKVTGGIITGRFELGVGDDGSTLWIQISGRVLDDLITFNAVYERYGTVISWVGQHTEQSGVGKIKTHWIHATNVTDNQAQEWMWFSNIIGSDIFTRV